MNALTILDLTNGFICVVATFVLSIRWHEAHRQYGDLLKGDNGILYLGIGWAFWAIMTVVQSFIQSENSLLLVVLSTCNNLFFLLAYQHLEHAPRVFPIKFTKINIPLARDNWPIVVLIIAFVSLFASIALDAIFEYNAIEGETRKIWVKVPELLVSIFMLWILRMALFNTYSVRKRGFFAILSSISIGLMILYQVQTLSEGVISESYFSWIKSGNPVDDEKIFFGLYRIVIKFLFLVCLIPLAETWIEERITLTDPRKMQLIFRGSKENGSDDPKFYITMTMDSNFKQKDIALSFLRFAQLLRLGIEKIRDPEAYIAFEESQEKALTRAFEDVAEEKAKADIKFSGNISELGSLQEHPKWSKKRSYLTQALRPNIIETDRAKKRLRIPPQNIIIEENVLYNCLDKLRNEQVGIEKRRLLTLIDGIKAVFKLSNGTIDSDMPQNDEI